MKKLFSPKIIAGLVITYLVTAGLAYAIVPSSGGGLLSPQVEDTPDTGIKTTGFGQFATEPKTEACPLNGKLFSKSEKALWEQKRPILTMIENHVEARPQSGLSSADIIYEAVAEGGITRFMGVFYCGAQADTAKVAPVRSARMYFVNLAAEYNTPIYMHVGGGNCGAEVPGGPCVSHKKALALEELQKMGWRRAGGNDFDTLFDIGYPVMLRDHNRLGANVEIATEHTMVASLPAAWREAAKRGFAASQKDGNSWISGFRNWKIDSGAALGSIPATQIKLEFWPGYKDFAVEWKYDAANNVYLRNQGGAAHIDLENQQQLSAGNVVVQFVKEENLGDVGKHMFYDVISSGKAIVFRGGKAEEITWKKAKQSERTIFTDKAGKEVSFIPGQIFIELIPAGNIIEYN